MKKKKESVYIHPESVAWTIAHARTHARNAHMHATYIRKLLINQFDMYVTTLVFGFAFGNIKESGWGFAI